MKAEIEKLELNIVESDIDIIMKFIENLINEKLVNSDT